MRGSRNFRQGGPGQFWRFFFFFLFFFCFFFSPQLIYRSQMVNFKQNLSFSRFQRGSNIFQGGGGGPTFSRGGGPIAIGTHITCDFPGSGVLTPCPPPLWIRRVILWLSLTEWRHVFLHFWRQMAQICPHLCCFLSILQTTPNISSLSSF